jgi:hypothetical protein
MTSSTITLCSACHKPVSLESAKTDADGKAIHDDCYLLSVNRTQTSYPTVR